MRGDLEIMNDNVILEIKDLHKNYEKQEVLKGISTNVNRGDVIAVIGPSGCGKSTFLRSLNLLEVPTKGQILFEGTDLTDKKTNINVVRQKIGMVFQQFNLFPNMTIKEYNACTCKAGNPFKARGFTKSG